MRTLNSTSKTRFWTMWNLVFSSERKYEKQSQKWAGLIMSCQSRRCSHCSISCGPRIDVHIWTIYSLPGKCWQMIGHSGRKRQCNNHQCTHHLSCVFEAGQSSPTGEETKSNIWLELLAGHTKWSLLISQKVSKCSHRGTRVGPLD